MQVPGAPVVQKWVLDSLELEIWWLNSETLCGCCELSLGSLQEQVLLPTESSFQLPDGIILT